MTPATILIVEDDGILAAHLQTCLTRLGYAILGPAAAGEDAVALLREQSADLALMDIELAGEMNGIETAEAIARLSDIPVLFLTGFSQEPLLEQAKSVAPYGYLIKPVAERELAATLTMALQRHGLNRELVRSREALAKSEARYRHIFEHSPLGIFQTTISGRVREANPALLRFLGYASADQLIAECPDIETGLYLNPEQRRTFLAQLDQSEAREVEVQVKKRSGQIAWVSISAQLTETDSLPGAEDARIINGFAIDVTERKRIEDAQRFLAQTNASHGEEPFFHTLARFLAENLAMDFICIDQLEGDGLTARTVAVWCDGHFEDNISYSLKDTPCGEVVGKTVCCFPTGVARMFPTDLVLQDLRAESYVGVTLWDHTGRPIGLIAVVGRNPLDNRQAAETILQMVAVRAAGELERQTAEDALKTTLKRFQIMLSSLYPGVLLVSDVGRVEFVNPSFLEMFALKESAEQLIGGLPAGLLQRMVKVVVDPLEFLDRTREILEKRQPIREEEIAITGGRTYLRDYVPIFIDGKHYGRLWLYYDVTERKRAAAALSESEQRFRNYFDLGLIGMATTAPDKRYLHCNDRLCEILGYSREELTQKTWAELTHPDDLAKDLARIVQIQRGETDTFLSEKRYIRKDGSIVFAEVSSRCVRNRDNSINHFVAMVQDVSVRKAAETRAKKLQSQLLQSQKLEAIGTLAGGIAHDFNNILAAVIGYTDMAKEMTPDGTPLAKDLDQVLKAGHRAKDLVKQILVFSRQNETEPMVLLPSTIVKEVIKLLRPSLPSTIAIEHQINPQAGPVRIDPTQLHQILMNLCTNAFHAMEETGGVLTVNLNAVRLEAGDLPAASAKPGDYAEITVADTGAGIAEDIRTRIFDPFFTTKELGKGTGMGLSIVHGIVAEYNGFVALDSEPGKGTTFRVYLPKAARDAADDALDFEPVPCGSEHILFVDDEEVLAEMVQSMLERLGYRVTIRTSALEALTTFQNHPDLFDLIITDQTMPGMTGLDLARRVLALRPQLPIILCTGYSTLISEEKAKAHGIREFALKPVTKKDLAVLIRKVLNPL
jgi:PAS domain S-box-containing protein